MNSRIQILEKLLAENLDESQQEVVFSRAPRILVLASAGAGKTRVLTHRLAFLHALYPRRDILAVTFTNRAAGEMKDRVENLLHTSGLTGFTGRLWISTFHAFCARVLRLYGSRIGIPADYLIADEYRQRQVFDEAVRSTGYDPRDFRKSFAVFRRYRVDHADPPPDLEPLLVQFWNRYRSLLKEMKSLDFADLQHETIRLFTEVPEVREAFQNRFVCVMVDEFQDTNAPQYRLFRLLRQGDHAFFVVGDQDQSIYGFRGSRPENFHRLLQDYPDTRKMALRYNYRTRDRIVRAAMELIARNPDRLPHEVEARARGGGIRWIEAHDEYEEGEAIAGFIAGVLQEHSDEKIAILVRTRSLLPDIERGLRSKNIDYRVIGLRSWWDSPPIRVVMDYLSFLHSPEVDAYFVAIFNIPSRKLGPVALTELREFCNENQYASLWEGLQAQARKGVFLRPGWETLYNDLLTLMKIKQEGTPFQVCEHLIQMLKQQWRIPEDRRESYLERWQQLLKTVSRHSTWDELMELIALTTPEDAEMEDGDRSPPVLLMTVHAAKGLEFDTVVIPGAEDGIYPHFLSQTEDEIREERRIFFVAMTRARREVVLTCARWRKGRKTDVSPFVLDIPPDTIQDMTGTKNKYPLYERKKEVRSKKFSKPRKSDGVLQPGDRVRHPKYGTGIVQSVQGSGPRTRVTVWFFHGETRVFRLDAAPIERLD